MSFDKYKTLIEEDDVVILYLNPNSMYAIKVKTNVVDKLGKTVDNVFQTTYGALKVKDLIGTEFGSKVTLSKGWAYVLHPTPELWTLTLPHRTQIIYTPDISMIILQLELRPGSVIVESGTGSGSLTHALARSVRPTGHVYTFDFHEQRVSVAQEEFSAHGLGAVVTSRHRDVCKQGFGEELTGRADAVFLDLPHPWLVIEHAIRTIKGSGLLSLIILQVVRIVSAAVLASVIRGEGQGLAIGGSVGVTGGGACGVCESKQREALRSGQASCVIFVYTELIQAKGMTQIPLPDFYEDFVLGGLYWFTLLSSISFSQTARSVGSTTDIEFCTRWGECALPPRNEIQEETERLGVGSDYDGRGRRAQSGGNLLKSRPCVIAPDPARLGNWGRVLSVPDFGSG
ncbi:tRNA (adenine(58)-N(1))-methyltransferase catalytic subunit trmt61a [Homalodisca vitripennis]|nr:tRNA (adenine(58)-N(1))-methyltransferase catalytic subunit trmt61a [Homalodisca vitripennis]